MGESMTVSNNSNEGRILWLKALLNSVLVWIAGFIIFLIPGFVVAMKMGFELGPKSQDTAAVSSQIGSDISEMYSNSTLLMGFYAGLFFVLIFWRAWAVAKGTGDKRIVNGILVSSIPVIVSLMFVFTGGVDIYSVIEILFFVGAGAIGGFFARTA
jgi:hypothetical protein